MITHTFLPRFVGGREKHVFYLSKELIKNGFEVCIFTGDQHTDDELEEYEGIKICRFPIHTLKFPATRERISYRVINPYDLIQSLRRYDPDIVHAHDYRHFTTDIAALYCKIERKPFILTVHGFFFDPHWTTRILMKLYDQTLGQFSLKSADKIICVSNKSVEESILKFRNKISVIPNGVPIGLTIDRQGFNGNFNKKYGLKNHKIILAVGRLCVQKGFQYLIQAHKNIISRNNGYQLCIIGPDAGYGKELKHLAEDTDSIIFTGSISENEIRDAYLSADLFILPSLAEGCPLTLLEAMAFGKPIVATSVGMVPEIIRNGVNGILVRPGNSDLLAEAIKVLDDESFSRNLAKNAEIDAIMYWNDFISKTRGIYEQVLA